jgi:CDP-glycerol glycerophosphotransferase
MHQPVELGKTVRNIVFVNPDSDISPLLAEIDVLVTDYAFIFFDCLLLERPILFYCQDLNDYIEGDRGFIFDYDAMIPGSMVATQTAMKSALDGICEAMIPGVGSEDDPMISFFDNHEGSAVDRLMALLDNVR